MPLNNRVFDFIEGLSGEVGVGSELVEKYEKLASKVRKRFPRSQRGASFSFTDVNFFSPLGISFGPESREEMQEFQDLQVLAEFLDLDSPFALENNPDLKDEIRLRFQTKEDIAIRVGEVGTPSAEQDQLSGLISDALRTASQAYGGGFTTPGVADSYRLFVRNYMGEQGHLGVGDLQNDEGFPIASSNFIALVEWREQIAENERFLQEAAGGNFDNLQLVADDLGVDITQAAGELERINETLQSQVSNIVLSNRDSVITQTYKEATDTGWLSRDDQDLNDVSISTLGDDEWELFLAINEFEAPVREYLEQNRAWVEDNFANRSNKTEDFFLWTTGEFLPEVNNLVTRFGAVQFGFHRDPILDPLINEFVQELPVEIRQSARERMREFIATVQIGPNQDKAVLWTEFLGGDHGATPDDVMNRYLGDLIGNRPGGREFVETARASGISLLDLADASLGDAQDFIDSITTNGAAQGLPQVQSVKAEALNQQAWIIEMFAQDPEVQNAPAVVRNAIYAEAGRQLGQLGLDPLNTDNKLDYSLALANTVGVTSLKEDVLEVIVRNSGENGNQLWEDLKRQTEGTFATGVFDIFNELPVDKDTLLIENLQVQLDEVAQELGPTPEEAARAGFAEKTRNLPVAFQSLANRRIEALLDAFPGQDAAELLEREDIQDRIALVIEQVGREFIGDNEVVELAVESLGGLNQFFEAFPDLQEADSETIGEFIVDNFDTIIESAGEDAEVTELTRARQRALTERRTEELRQRRQVLQNEAEERALEFDESEQGQELARLREQEGLRQEQISVFRPELERLVRQRVAGPAASQVLADVGSQLERQFVRRQEGIQAGGGEVTLTPQDFLGQLDDDFFQQQRRLSNIRRTPVNIAAPQSIGLSPAQQQGPGFNPLRRGL
jgi:hypothetical protein